MVKSDRCYLKGLAPAELIRHHEEAEVRAVLLNLSFFFSNLLFFFFFSNSRLCRKWEAISSSTATKESFACCCCLAATTFVNTLLISFFLVFFCLNHTHISKHRWWSSHAKHLSSVAHTTASLVRKCAVSVLISHHRFALKSMMKVMNVIEEIHHRHFMVVIPPSYFLSQKQTMTLHYLNTGTCTLGFSFRKQQYLIPVILIFRVREIAQRKLLQEKKK